VVWRGIAGHRHRGGAAKDRQQHYLQEHLLKLTEARVVAEVDIGVLDQLTWILTEPAWTRTWRTWQRERAAVVQHRVALLDAVDRRRSWLRRSVSAMDYWPLVWLSRALAVVRGARTPGISEIDLEGFLTRQGGALLHALQEVVEATPPSSTYYASGTNHVGEVRGYASVGHAIGVTAPEVSQTVEAALLNLDSAVRVFVDSGAFGEFTRGTPISSAMWVERLELYARLAQGLGRQLAVVAPDKVGDQENSLVRLREHAQRVQHLHRLGAQVIVPLQVGTLSLVEVYDRVWKMLRCPFTPGLPSNKAALSEEELAALLERRKPERIHFLGLGPKTRRRHGRRLLEIARTLSPGTRVAMDSALRKALVGRASGLRPLTAAEDQVEDELRAGARSGMEGRDADGWDLPDYTDHIASPSTWLTDRQLKTIAREMILRGRERRRFLADPDAFLQAHCWEELPEEVASRCPELETALEAAWDRLWHQQTRAEKKQRAIERILQDQ